MRAYQPPRVQRGPSSSFLIGLACITIFIHLMLTRSSIEHRINSCSGHASSEDRLLRQFQSIEEKLDALHVTNGATNVSSILFSLRAEVKTVVEEFRGSGDGAQETISSFQDSRMLGRIAQKLEEAGASDIELPQNRPRIKLFIGVFSGINDAGRKESGNAEDTLRYDYRRRRKALRETWFPSTREERERLEREFGIVIRFVAGHSTDVKEEALLADEENENGDFLRIPHIESYYGLPNKTKTFFASALSLYDPEWVVKVDDDVYYMIERTLLAIKQWDKMGATYIGCMKHGHVWSSEESRWYEPQHMLFGSDYFLHAYGSIYAMHKSVVQNVILRNFRNLRTFANEDVTVGSWMLGQNVVHFEDMRLCATKCSEAAIGILRNGCAGLCNPLKDLYLIHHAKSCQGPPKNPLPYLPSYPEHKAFEKMRV